MTAEPRYGQLAVSDEPVDAVRSARLIAAALVAVAAGLRVASLNSGLWIDEIITISESARPWTELVTVYSGSNHHPLYTLLMRGAIELVGETPWVARLPACLMGIASVAMLYVLAERLVWRWEALAAAAILATSYHHVWFSQSARGYTIQGFSVLCATYALLRGLEHGRRRDWFLYGTAAVAGIYAHLTMALVVVAHVAVVLIGAAMRWRPLLTRHVRAFLRTAALVVVVSLALQAFFLPAFLERTEPRRTPGYEEVSRVGWMLSTAWSSVVEAVGLPAALGGVLVALCGVVGLWRRHPLATALLVAPLVAVPLPLVIIARPLYPRFLFFGTGVAALVVARGLGVMADTIVPRRIGRRGRLVAAATVVGALAVAGASAPGLIRNYRVPKQDYAGAERFLLEAERRGARNAVTTGLCVYQRYRAGPPDWPCLITAADFDALAPCASPPTLIAHTLSVHMHRSLRTRLREHCPRVERFPGTLADGTIDVCEVRCGQS
jgi:hypothetical protein